MNNCIFQTLQPKAMQFFIIKFIFIFIFIWVSTGPWKLRIRTVAQREDGMNKVLFPFFSQHFIYFLYWHNCCFLLLCFAVLFTLLNAIFRPFGIKNYKNIVNFQKNKYFSTHSMDKSILRMKLSMQPNYGAPHISPPGTVDIEPNMQSNFAKHRTLPFCHSAMRQCHMRPGHT